MMTFTEKYGYLVNHFVVREHLPPGTELRTVLRHVSPSGMTRWIDVYGPGFDYLSHLVATVIGWPVNQGRHDGVEVGGCGMDMGFALVYNFGQVIWPDGFDTTNYWANSEDSRGARPYWRNEQLDHDSSGGYAYRQRWL